MSTRRHIKEKQKHKWAPTVCFKRRDDIHEFFLFDGSLQLHMVRPIEHGDKRFTLLWYTEATRWLKKLSDSDREELTQSGYCHSVCVAGSYLNDGDVFCGDVVAKNHVQAITPLIDVLGAALNTRLLPASQQNYAVCWCGNKTS